MRKLHKMRPIDGGATYPLMQRSYRLAWMLCWTLFCSYTPPALWRWRCFFLRLFGARIGQRCDVRGSARVWSPANLIMEDWSLIGPEVICYNPAQIRLRSGALISQRAYLCSASHNVDSEGFELKAKPIEIGEGAWVAASAFVGPGVTIHSGAVLGACAAAFGDLEAWTVYRGNPAMPLRGRQQSSPARRIIFSEEHQT